MLSDIKKELINHPDKLRDVLEHFNYCNIAVRPQYLQFGRDENSSKKSIVIKLENNQYLWVKDYARNIEKDIFSYIMEQRNVDFSEVLNVVKNILGISDYYDFFERKGIFGGFYDRIRKRNTVQIKIYDNSILNCYKKMGNLRFLRDNISLEAQHFFDIRYDVESQGIVIPIYSQIGHLMGVKIRLNYEVPDGEQKYFYTVPCMASQTLYGYFQNYNFLVGNIVYIYESEKSVMQCFSYGIRNCVALGSGSISLAQIKMIFELNPQKIIFMHDIGYGLDNIMKNINLVQSYSRFSEVQIGYWDCYKNHYEGKFSPSDLGKEFLKRIMRTEIKMIGDEEDGEEL